MNSRLDEPNDGSENWVRMGNAGVGVLRIALLFGSAVIALTLVLVPLLERRSQHASVFLPSIDHFATGSVEERSAAYTVRRSVLQTYPQDICIIRSDGSKRGAC